MLAAGDGNDFKNYYRMLGVRSTASDAAIKAAFRRLARQHHPDVTPEDGAAERFRQIREAYDVLSDSERRRAYDRLYSARRPGPRRTGSRTRRAGGRSRGFGITLDVLGLRAHLSVGGDPDRGR